MVAKLQILAVAWYRAEDYQRIREISDDEMLPTFAEFEAKATQKLANLEADGVIGKKVIIDPDELLAYAQGRKIDFKLRSEYIATLLLSKYETTH